MFHDSHSRVRLHDNVVVKVWRELKSGRLRLTDEFSVHNLVTTAGMALTSEHLVDAASPTVSYLAVGTGNTPPTNADTGLQTEVFRDFITKADKGSFGSSSISYFLPTTNANGNTLREIGAFTAAVGGILYARALLSPTIVKNSTKAVTFLWTFSIFPYA